MNRQAVFKTVMDEPARRVLHRFKHGESVNPYRSESGFVFITLLQTKSAQIRVKFVYDVDGRYGKNIGFPYWSRNRPNTVLKG